MRVDENFLTAEQRAMEAALAALVPASLGIDRDALLFAAGEAAGRGNVKRLTVWPWKVAACVGFACSAALGGLAIHRPVLIQATTVVQTPSPAANPLVVAETSDEHTPPALFAWVSKTFSPAATASDSPWAYHNLIDVVLMRGLDAIPSAPNGAASSCSNTPLDVQSLTVPGESLDHGGQS